jgi:putative nucleotidyltransferase with HDIG domain
LLHDIAKPVTAERDAETGAIHFYGHEKVGAEMARAILNRLRFPKKQIDEIVACVLHHMQFKDVKQMRKATLRRLLLARDVSAGTGIAPAGLPRLARRSGALRFFNSAGGGIEKETGDPSAAAHGEKI